MPVARHVETGGPHPDESVPASQAHRPGGDALMLQQPQDQAAVWPVARASLPEGLWLTAPTPRSWLQPCRTLVFLVSLFFSSTGFLICKFRVVVEWPASQTQGRCCAHVSIALLENQQGRRPKVLSSWIPGGRAALGPKLWGDG